MKFKTQIPPVLYSIEEAIKTYRKFCQNNIDKIPLDITVDQALLLIFIERNPKLSQKEMAEFLFKDNASITRMIELMVKKNFLKREISKSDRRRYQLIISDNGNKTLTLLAPTVQYNRSTALNGFTNDEIIQLYNSLQKIINNCEKPNK